MLADSCRFHSGHLWSRTTPQGDLLIGMSDFAQQTLGEIVYFELPAAGTEVVAGEPMGTVESIKVVNDLIAPVSGRVVEVNADLAESPTLPNDDPYDRGWLIRLRANDAADLDALMDHERYQTFTGD